MVVNGKKQKKDAPAVMKERGKVTDNLVLTFIKENPDTTIREIAEYYDISNGRVDHSVTRLKEKGLVEVTFFRRNRGLVKKVRLVDTEIAPLDEVSFPLVGLDKTKWNDAVFICALSRSAIKVSSTLRDEWKDECILIKKSNLIKDENMIKFKLPEKFVDFYEIPNSEIDVSGYNDEILLTINSTIIPVELPYNYEPQYDFHYIRGNIRVLIEEEYELIKCKIRPGDSTTTSETTINETLEDLINGTTLRASAHSS
jgi:hypothetical protein